MTVIGSAYVNIRAITDKLESDIRKALDSIKDSVTLTVDADVSSATAKLDALSQSHLDDQTVKVDADTTAAQASLDALASTVLGDQTITIHADTAGAIRGLENVANLSHLEDQTVHINVEADPTQAIIDLHAIANESLNATVQVEADTLAARAEFDHMLDDMGHSNDPTITPDVDDAVARVRLALLTRSRKIKVDFKVLVDESGAKTIGSYLTRLSGLRVAVGNAKDLVHEFANIDQAVIGISIGAVKFATMASAILSASQGALTLGASLLSVVQMVGFAAPGMFAGFMVGIGTMMVALKDFKNQLPGVVAEYATLGTVIKENFWSVARKEVGEMADTLFPAFKRGLADTSKALGGWVFSLAYALKVGLTNNVLEGMFNRLSDSIKIASSANGPLVDGMIKLGQVGSDLLPRLAQWWVDVATKFDNFISGAVASGEMSKWIEEGITALHQLGRVVSDVAHIFNTLTGAAQIAGSDGLGTIVKVLDNIRAAVDSPQGASALITIFEGANVASSALAKGIGDILGAIGSAAPAIKSSFESVGGVINVLSGAITQIISNPEFQAGLAAMFDGIQKGAEALLPVLGTTGPKIGALLSIIGNLAANIGGILGAALQVALPFITAFKKAIDPLIPILGDFLVKAIGDLAPTFDMLATAITQVAPFVADLVKVVADLISGLIETVGPALPGITAAVVAFFVAWKAVNLVQDGIGIVKTIAGGFKDAIAAVQLMTTANSFLEASQISVNLAFLANPVALVIAAVVALIAIIVVAYNNIGWFKDGVDAAVKWIGEAWQNMCKWIGEAWNNTIQFIGDAWSNTSGMFTDFFNNTVGMFTDFFNNTVGMFSDFFSNTIGMFSDWFGGVVGLFGDIGKGISDAFNGVVDFISNIINTIVTVISTGVQIYIGIWVGAFNIMRDIFMNIWNGIISFFQPLIDLIGAIIKGVIDITLAIWQVAWDIISTIFIGVWTNLVRFFTPIIQGIQDAIGNAVNWVVNAWNTAWQAVSDFFTGIWNGIVAFVTPIVQAISDTITGVVNGIHDWWNATWQGIVDYFTMVWNLMVAIYTPIIQGISDGITGFVNGVRDVWNAVWGGISDFFSSTWNNIVNYVTPIINTIHAIITVAITAIQNAWNNTWSAVGGFFSDVWNNIVNGVTGFVRNVQDRIREVIDTAGRIGSDILKGIGDFGNTLYNAGSDLIRGLANGITDMTAWVVDKVKGVGAGIVDGLKNFFGIKSPSRVMRDQVGKQLGLGLAIGIEASIGAVVKATEKLAAAAVPDIADIMLPAVKTASVASQTASTAATASPALTRASVTGTSATSTTGTNAFGTPNGGITNVNFNVQTSPGLNEVQIGEHAMNYMYWKLASSTPL